MEKKKIVMYALHCEICGGLIGYTNSEDVIGYMDKFYCKNCKSKANENYKQFNQYTQAIKKC